MKTIGLFILALLLGTSMTLVAVPAPEMPEDPVMQIVSYMNTIGDSTLSTPESKAATVDLFVHFLQIGKVLSSQEASQSAQKIDVFALQTVNQVLGTVSSQLQAAPSNMQPQDVKSLQGNILKYLQSGSSVLGSIQNGLDPSGAVLAGTSSLSSDSLNSVATALNSATNAQATQLNSSAADVVPLALAPENIESFNDSLTHQLNVAMPAVGNNAPVAKPSAGPLPVSPNPDASEPVFGS